MIGIGSRVDRTQVDFGVTTILKIKKNVSFTIKIKYTDYLK